MAIQRLDARITLPLPDRGEWPLQAVGHPLRAAEMAVSPASSSPFVGRPLGDTRARTRTSASIVAILRAAKVIPSPGPDFRFESGDVIVAVGTRKGLDALTRILANNDPDG